MNQLIKNEVSKILLKKKMVLIAVLLFLFIGLFSYGEKYTYDKTISRFEEITEDTSYDWKSLASQQMMGLEKRLESPYIHEVGIKSIEIQIEQMKYFIENDINPITPSSARFSVDFVENAIIMFIPLMIIILASDLVSGEFSNRTIKVILTRSVPRWKVLLSKYIALLMMTTMVVLMIGAISTFVSFFFFRIWGFYEPVATGFKLINGDLDANSVIMVNRMEYMVLIYSLAWFVSIAIASITFMISVLVKSTAEAIGIIMAFLIGGQFLQFFLSDWEIIKYFFVSNLNLTKYLTGSYQQIEGMTMKFSIMVLAMWSLVSIIISFVVFTRKDVLA
jgi:ABC-2 type transport system permease protein